MQEEIFSSRRSNLIFILLILVNVFFLTSHLNSHVKILKNFLYYVFNPAPASAEKVVESGGQILTNLREIVSVREENAALKREIEKYNYLEKDYATILEENERLKKISGLSFPLKKKAVISRVVAREPSSWFEWIIIDKGAEDGLFADAPVLAWVDQRLVVLGRVWEVYSDSAKVILVTNTLCSVPVEVRDLKEDGLIEGQNNGVLKLNYLLPESTVKTGDEIVTSPVSRVFPPGITVGYVKDIFAPTKTSTMKAATVKPAFHSSSLKLVAILLPSGKAR